MRRLRGKWGGVKRKRGKRGVMWDRTHRDSTALEGEFVFDEPIAEPIPGDKRTVELTGEIVDAMVVGVVWVELRTSPAQFPGAVVVRVSTE